MLRRRQTVRNTLSLGRRLDLGTNQRLHSLRWKWHWLRGDRRVASLLNSALMLLFECLHLLLLFVTPVNSLSDGATNGTPNILASMVVTQDISRADTMWDKTLLILAFGNVFP
jgi:hypothetical protein